jgi:hypothetical protein
MMLKSQSHTGGRRLRRIRSRLSLCFILACLSAVSFAQSLAGLGALHGIVTDASGAVVAKAEIVVSNPAIGLTRVLSTSSEGFFEASSLPPTDGYKVTVTMAGFSTYVAKGISVHVGQNASLNVVLGLSQASESVLVDASETTLDVTRLGVSELVSQKEINDLPINGILTPVTGSGKGTASAGFPDGTNARREQVSVRYTF